MHVRVASLRNPGSSPGADNAARGLSSRSRGVHDSQPNRSPRVVNDFLAAVFPVPQWQTEDDMNTSAPGSRRCLLTVAGTADAPRRRARDHSAGPRGARAPLKIAGMRGGPARRRLSPLRYRNQRLRFDRVGYGYYDIPVRLLASAPRS